MLDVLLRTHRDPDDIDFDLLWGKALFIFDANVLLDLYRLPASASNDLLGVLQDEQLRQRIWIAFQVMVEFLYNRHEAISDQKNKFNTVRDLLGEASGQYDDVFEKLQDELGKLKLKQRHSLIDPDKFITPEKIASGRSIFDEFLKELSALETKQADVNDRDLIKDTVVEMFRGKTGEGFTSKELTEIYRSGEKRYEASIPPGFKDKSKQGSYTVEDRELVRKYGDLILWLEIIRKAQTDSVDHIVLVTGDVKEDWWLEKRGRKLGARRELLNEIYSQAKSVKTFYMYDTASFLRHAKTHLKASVQDSSITQAKDLIEKGRKHRAAVEEGFLYLSDVIREIASKATRLRVGIGKSVHSLQAVKLGYDSLFRCLVEILSNARRHGIYEYVGVQAKDRGDVIALRFKNRVSPDAVPMISDSTAEASSPPRGTGLADIEATMGREGVSVGTSRTEKIFLIELLIPKSKFFAER